MGTELDGSIGDDSNHGGRVSPPQTEEAILQVSPVDQFVGLLRSNAIHTHTQNWMKTSDTPLTAERWNVISFTNKEQKSSFRTEQCIVSGLAYLGRESCWRYWNTKYIFDMNNGIYFTPKNPKTKPFKLMWAPCASTGQHLRTVSTFSSEDSPWKIILVLSNGATAVLAMAPAKAPEKRESMTDCVCFRLC